MTESSRDRIMTESRETEYRMRKSEEEKVRKWKNALNYVGGERF